jgi:hypothetical protein
MANIQRTTSPGDANAGFSMRWAANRNAESCERVDAGTITVLRLLPTLKAS